mmetsp:Transcript_7071/g.17767  ORF Transcript_7071/g.17767 Transcript_7071/m.17767 type:complete len:479 (-) Transcript_7071:197-1633(-)
MKYSHVKGLLSCSVICLGLIFTGTFFNLQSKVEGSAGSDGKALTIRTNVATANKNHQNASDSHSESDVPRSSANSTKQTPPSHLITQSAAIQHGDEISGSEPEVKIGNTESKQQQILNDPIPSTTGSQIREHSQKEEKYNVTTPILEFSRQEGVVIVTKIHGPHQLSLLKQSMCLFHYAYNNKVNYDVVVFTTIPVKESDHLLDEIRTAISPARLTMVLDNEGIVNEIDKLSPVRRRNFLERCNATSPKEITWDFECNEEGAGRGRISYNWQAEFRSWHIWRHESLRRYRYMMWIDTDAFCTKPWERDPIAVAIKNNLVIYFENYPQGRAKAAQQVVKEVFGKYLCYARKSPNGPLVSSLSDDCGGSQLWTIHGFFHITDLDFFRQDQVMHWAEKMIGDCFLCRKFDDQLAVTVPAVIMAPERSWDMYKSGVELSIFHNHLIDGKRKKKAGGFHSYWKQNAESQFPDAWNKCQITEGD